jgi:hypothetical protein
MLTSFSVVHQYNTDSYGEFRGWIRPLEKVIRIFSEFGWSEQTLFWLTLPIFDAFTRLLLSHLLRIYTLEFYKGYSGIWGSREDEKQQKLG